MMKKTVVLILSAVWLSFGQDDNKLDIPESAEVFLEEYTDKFQSTFFEALKQKGIQNYDRAINLLLECKQLNVATNVLDHELAKTHFLDKNYIDAQKYAVEALVQNPENYWYLDTLMEILSAQSNALDAIKHTIPYENEGLQKNLTRFYFKKKKYTEASEIAQRLPDSPFKQMITLKIEEVLGSSPSSRKINNEVIKTPKDNNPAEILKNSLEQQIRSEQFRALERSAKEAVEAYPLQPFFHYAYGLALHKNDKQQLGIASMETALDYLLDDVPLANRIYKALAEAYTNTGNSSKANEYLRKIQSGF